MEISHSYRTKLARRVQKYTSILKSEIGIEPVPQSQYIMVCNAGLGLNVDREKIVALFSPYTTVQNVVMNYKKSYCFVECIDQSTACAAFDAIHGKLFLAEVHGPLYLLYVEKMPEEDLAKVCRRIPKGLIIFSDFLKEDEEKSITDFMLREFKSGSKLKHRAVKHYGYEFDYKTNNVKLDNSACERIPEEFDFMLQRFKRHGYLKDWNPNQITVNKYEPGQGIPAHIDTHSCFDDYIVVVSAGSDTSMSFRQGLEKHSVTLQRRSLVLMSGESRYSWSHGIAPRKYDFPKYENGERIVQERGQRISFTFRHVRENRVCKCPFPEYCDTPEDIRKSERQLQIDDTAASELERLHVHEVYDEIADHFSKTRHKPWPNVKKFVRSFEPGSIFIDIGCGNGKYFGLNSSIYQVGCDRSHKLSEECHKKGFEVLVCDCLALPYRSNIADYCVCIAVIHHLSTRERRLQAIKEIARILRPSGRALMYVWAKEQKLFRELSTYLKQRIQFRNHPDNYEEYSIALPAGGAEEDKTSRNEISLPIHVNRTEFKYEDMLVPWKLQKKKGDNQEHQFLRYYHVFDDGELEELCQHVPGIEVIKCYYDEGNWSLMFKKVTDSDDAR